MDGNQLNLKRVLNMLRMYHLYPAKSLKLEIKYLYFLKMNTKLCTWNIYVIKITINQ